MTTLLLDSDIFAFRAAASAEEEDVDIAIMRLDNMMVDILSYGDSYRSFLTGSQHNYPITDVVNFRKIINPEYKANRKDLIAPIHLDMCRKYLIEEYNTEVTIGYEADDALGINQTEETVIVSIDKDLKQIEGAHYNFVTKQYSEVSYLDGLRSVYKQALIGDTSDNIKGVAGLGKVKAAKIIDPLMSELDMFNTVKSLYSDDVRFFLNMNCLWIWHKENEKYSDRDWLKHLGFY